MKRKFLAALVCLILVTVVATSALASVRIMKVTVDGARVRTGPGNYEVLGSLKKGTYLYYTGKTNGAYRKVYTATGKTGWVFRGHMEKVGTVQDEQMFTATVKCPVYKEPSKSARRVDALREGECVVVFSSNSVWASVKTLSGHAGYVRVSHLKKL